MFDLKMIGTDRAVFARWATFCYAAAMDVTLHWRVSKKKGVN